jgi:hypothetical protein
VAADKISIGIVTAKTINANRNLMVIR